MCTLCSLEIDSHKRLINRKLGRLYAANSKQITRSMLHTVSILHFSFLYISKKPCRKFNTFQVIENVSRSSKSCYELFSTSLIYEWRHFTLVMFQAPFKVRTCLLRVI